MRLAVDQFTDGQKRSIGKDLDRRNLTTPKPLSITPSGYWHGNDGPWSSFALGLGTESQFINVFVSTSANTPWAVVPEACGASDPADCKSSRGGIFDRNQSSTYENIGQFALGFEENLGYSATGLYGYDTISLGLVGSGAPVLQHQVVTGIRTTDFWLPSLGIRPTPSNFSTLGEPVTAWMSTLKENNLIPSLSWAYTAGSYAHYKDNKSGLGSLTLGGYDASLFEPHDINFDFGPDISRDLLVGLQSISVEGTAISKTNLLSEPIFSFIDSGVAQMWFPRATCDLFAQAFGLSYFEDMNLYLMNNTEYQQLVGQNSSIEFVIGAEKEGGSTVTITLPFFAFDLGLTPDYPGIEESTRYFPLRQAANESQFTLGRAFLQHAYVIANYEVSKFSVHQARFADSSKQDLKPILPASSSNSTQSDTTAQSSGLTAGALAGIIAAIVVMLLITASGAFVFYRRRLAKAKQNIQSGKSPAYEVAANEKPELATPAVPLYKKVLGLGPRRVIAELETPPIELEVPKVNHEVPAREKLPDRDSVSSEMEGDDHGQVYELGVKHEVYELP